MNRRHRVHPSSTMSTITHTSVVSLDEDPERIMVDSVNRINILANELTEQRYYIDFPIFEGNRPRRQQPERCFHVDHGADGHCRDIDSDTVAYYCASFERSVLKEVLSSSGLIRKSLRGKMKMTKKKKKNYTDSKGRQQSLFVSLYWTNHLSIKMLRSLVNGQRVNHFPNSWCIGRKDRLLLCLEKARRHNRSRSRNRGLRSINKNTTSRQDDYNFTPKTWLMPRDYDKWKKYSIMKKNQIYIIKPVAGRQGNGIRLIKSHKDVDRHKAMVIQEYISSPYLVQGKKSDLRLYVLVSSFDPLRAYLYNNGILRCASEPYTKKAKASKYSFLTNYSINKKRERTVTSNFSKSCLGQSTSTSPNGYKTKASSDEKDLDHTCDADKIKMTLDQFWALVGDKEGQDAVVRCKADIRDIIVKTLIAADTEITPTLRSITRSRRCCFELYGFDIMLDSTLRPWLLEVNVSPSLMTRTEVDKQVKFPLVSDMFHLIGICHPLKKNEVHTVMNTTSRSQSSKNKTKKKTDLLGHHAHTDQDLIRDYRDEIHRKRNFECIYPCPSTCSLYVGCFDLRNRWADATLADFVTGTRK